MGRESRNTKASGDKSMEAAKYLSPVGVPSHCGTADGIAVRMRRHRTPRRGPSRGNTRPDLRIPRGMESALAGTRWLAGPPFGGSYDWLPPTRAAADSNDDAKKSAAGGLIAVTAFSPAPPLSLTADDLRHIDAKLDDGNLATGRFRTGFNGWPVYLVGSAP